MVIKLLKALATVISALVGLTLALCFLMTLLLGKGAGAAAQTPEAADMAVFDRFQMYMTNRISSALEGVLEVEKVYWLSDEDPVAPEPDPEKFGTTEDPASLSWLLEDAQTLLKGQSTVFSTDTPLAPGTEAMYYLDDTIFAVTWKQGIGETMYTVSEVKIAHPSQFRRFLSGGSYGSGKLMMTTQMAESVNAVVASSGDYYSFRRMGAIVYNGAVQRVNTQEVDTCYIDRKGDLLFTYRTEMNDMGQIQEFVEENGIRFSLAFGPVLVEGGQKVPITGYVIGEPFGNYARSALCQMDELHYLLVVAGREGNYQTTTTLMEFQDVVASFGCEKAYTLDGGQTAAIVMNDQLINRVVYGYKRDISDIIYFATAIPDGE